MSSDKITAVDMDLVRTWAMEAGRIALAGSADRRVDLKPDLTPVTRIDKEIETFLLERIARQYPDHSVLAEEGGNRSGSDFTWIIDPIDGTRAYASRLPIWGISIGVFHQEEPYAGVFYLPMTGETYWATCEAAFYNERRLLPPTSVDLHSPLSFIAIPSNGHLHFDIDFPRIRSLGSAAAQLAYVSYGSATAALTREISIWDMAAVLPSFVVTETKLVHLDGKPFRPADLLDGRKTPQPLIAAHASIIDEVRSLIKPRHLVPGG